MALTHLGTTGLGLSNPGLPTCHTARPRAPCTLELLVAESSTVQLAFYSQSTKNANNKKQITIGSDHAPESSLLRWGGMAKRGCIRSAWRGWLHCAADARDVLACRGPRAGRTSRSRSSMLSSSLDLFLLSVIAGSLRTCARRVSASFPAVQAVCLSSCPSEGGISGGGGGGDGEGEEIAQGIMTVANPTVTSRWGPWAKASQPPGMLTPSKQKCGERVGSFDWLGKDNATWTKIPMFKVPRLHCQTVPVLEGSSVARNASDTAGLAGARKPTSQALDRPSTGLSVPLSANTACLFLPGPYPWGPVSYT